MSQSNDPKVLVEFTPDEIAWLADRLHEEWQRSLSAKAAVHHDTEKLAKVEAHQEMERRLRNRILDKASEQGFGNL